MKDLGFNRTAKEGVCRKTLALPLPFSTCAVGDFPVRRRIMVQLFFISPMRSLLACVL